LECGREATQQTERGKGRKRVKQKGRLHEVHLGERHRTQKKLMGQDKKGWRKPKGWEVVKLNQRGGLHRLSGDKRDVAPTGQMQGGRVATAGGGVEKKKNKQKEKYSHYCENSSEKRRGGGRLEECKPAFRSGGSK